MASGPARILPWLFAASVPACALLALPLAGANLPMWLWPALGGALGLSLLAFRPSLPTGVVIGAALLAVSGFLGQQGAPKIADFRSEADVPFHDLTEGPLPADLRGRVRIRGHLISEPKLDEYAVAQGDAPNQNEAPFATVRLLLPTAEFAIPSEGAYVAARIPLAQGSERQNGADLVEGTLAPLPEGLVGPLFGGQVPPEGTGPGLLLDAGTRITAKDIAFDVALSLLAALLALMAWRGAFSSPNEAEPQPEAAAS